MILLGIAVVFSMVGIVAAADTDTEIELSNIPEYVGDSTSKISSSQKTGQTVLTYSIMQQTYTVTIPADFAFNELQTTIVRGNVTATEVTLKGGNYLSITVNSTHDFNMVQHEDANENDVSITESTPRFAYNMTYTITGHSPVEVSHDTHVDNNRAPIEVLNVTTGTKFAQTPLEFKKVGLAPDLGIFKDTLIFEAKIIGSQA